MAIDKTYENLMRTWQPQQKNLFEMTVEGVDQFVTDGGYLSLVLTSVSLPKEDSDEIVMPFLNTEIYYASKTKISEFTAEFKDFCDPNIMKSLIAWRKKVWDADTHRAGLAKDYKKTATLILYGPEWSIIRQWKLYGVWPKSLDPGTVSMDDTGQVQVSVSFRADKVKADAGLASV